ncbi:MAG: TldD/PmbA family protein, partial [Mycobacterium sp.]
MIPATQVVDIALEAARADETIVLVTDRAEASLRWAGNSMTTNGVSTSRSTTVISIAREGANARIGSLRSAEVDPSLIAGLVAASAEAASAAPQARDAAPLLSGTGGRGDWDTPVPGTGAEVFAGVAGTLSRGFRGADQLYGFAHHVVETTFVASSTGLRRRYTQPTGSVEINAKRGGASAWAGVGTPD